MTAAVIPFTRNTAYARAIAKWQAQAWGILGRSGRDLVAAHARAPLPPDPRPAVSHSPPRTEQDALTRDITPEEAVAKALQVDDAIIELITDYQALSAVDRAAVRKLARALARPKHLRPR
jgi:hypothetical protein